jgi:hypothetical protein
MQINVVMNYKFLYICQENQKNQPFGTGGGAKYFPIA